MDLVTQIDLCSTETQLSNVCKWDVNRCWQHCHRSTCCVLLSVDDDRTTAPPERCWSQGRARRYMDSVTQIILCSTEAHLSNVYERHVNWCWLQCHRCSCCVLLSHTWVDVVMKDSPPFYTQRTVKALCKLRFWSLGSSSQCLDWVTQIVLFHDDAQLSDVCICMYVCRSRLVTRWSFAGL